MQGSPTVTRIEIGSTYDPERSGGRTDWYLAAMERLVEVVQDLSHARDLNAVMAIVRIAARELTGADGATFVLRDGHQCYYAEENAISPLWKGQRFPLEACISGWVMLNGQAAAIPDIYNDPRIPADAYRLTFVKSLVMVPIRKLLPIAAIGNYWAQTHNPTGEELSILEALANVTAVAMENVELQSRLHQKILALETSNQDLSQLAWAASHDLKSPLRAIYNISEWISEDIGAAASAKCHEHLAKLRARVRRMESLLDSILDYATVTHQENPILGGIVLGSMLESDILSLTNVPEEFSVVFAPAMANISVLRLPMQRIFCNLVGNSIKHHDRSAGVIEIDVEDKETQYVFSVKDDGPGIPHEYHTKIFDMFQKLQSRDQSEGCGIGLAMVKKIVTRYGGGIEVISGSGRGTEFRFTWPKISDIAVPRQRGIN